MVRDGAEILRIAEMIHMAKYGPSAAEIASERALVSANRELVERMEGRIAAAIGRVWYD